MTPRFRLVLGCTVRPVPEPLSWRAGVEERTRLASRKIGVGGRCASTDTDGGASTPGTVVRSKSPAPTKTRRFLAALSLILVALATWGLLAHADELARHVTPWRAIGAYAVEAAWLLLCCWLAYQAGRYADAQHGRGR